MRTWPFKAHLKAHEKALRFQGVLEKEFITSENIICSKRSRSESHSLYTDDAHQAELTALALLAEVHRYKVTKNLDAIYNINRFLDSLELLFKITNIDGYPAAAVAPSMAVKTEWKWNSASPKFDVGDRVTNFHWKGNTSLETLSAINLSLIEIYHHADKFPQLLNRVKPLIVALAERIYRNEGVVRGLNDLPTTDSDLETHLSLLPGWIVYSSGSGSLNSLAFQATAFEVTGEAKFKSRILELVANEALEHLYPHQVSLCSDSAEIEAKAFYATRALLSCGSFPADFKEPVKKAIHQAWKDRGDRRNVFWASLIFPWIKLDKELRENASQFLSEYPDQRVSEAYDFEDVFDSAWFSSEAKEPLPLNARGGHPIIWNSDPFVLKYEPKDHSSEVYAPVDFLVAYWLARSGRLIQEGNSSESYKKKEN